MTDKDLKKILRGGNEISFTLARRVVEKLGYYFQRVNGSHFIFRNREGLTIIIAVHNGKTKKYYLKHILAPFKYDEKL